MFFSSGDTPIRVSPSEVLRIWGEVTERTDLLHKSCAEPASAQHCKLPFCPFQSTDEGLYSLNKIAGFIFPYVRFVTQFEQYFAFYSNHHEHVSPLFLYCNGHVSAEHLVNPVSKGRLLTLKSHVSAVFQPGVGLHRCRSTAFLSIGPKVPTFSADGHSTCLLLEDFINFLLPTTLHFPLGLSKRKENLTSSCLHCREWCLPYIGERTKTPWCARV